MRTKLDTAARDQQIMTEHFQEIIRAKEQELNLARDMLESQRKAHKQAMTSLRTDVGVAHSPTTAGTTNECFTSADHPVIVDSKDEKWESKRDPVTSSNRRNVTVCLFSVSCVNSESV